MTLSPRRTKQLGQTAHLTPLGINKADVEERENLHWSTRPGMALSENVIQKDKATLIMAQ